MKRKLLAVAPESGNYSPLYEVHMARSFEEAKAMIIRTEADGAPFDDLDLPVSDEEQFWEFVEWMEATQRRYPFSIFGCGSLQFMRIAGEVRRRGFHFNS